MPSRITRRSAARLFLAAPAALALPKVLEGTPAPRRRPGPSGLSAADRRNVEKSVSQLRSTAEKLRKVAVPMGSEPAFVFRPILPSK
jgi:hypothetical protein